MRLPLLIGRSRGTKQGYVLLCHPERSQGPGGWAVRYRAVSADLHSIYLRTLEACAPERLVARVLEPGMPRDVVAIGKCAGALLDGLQDVGDAFVAIPEGYR